MHNNIIDDEWQNFVSNNYTDKSSSDDEEDCQEFEETNEKTTSNYDLNSNSKNNFGYETITHNNIKKQNN